MATYASAEIRRIVDSQLAQYPFDILHIIFSFVARNISTRIRIPIVVEEPNLESIVLRQRSIYESNPVKRLLLMAESSRLRAGERLALERSTRYIVSSARDKEVFAGHPAYSDVRVVSNGVDTDYYLFGFAAKSSVPLVLFLGNFAYAPNVDAAELLAYRIFPAILQEMPSARLKILGYAAESRLRHLAGGRHLQLKDFTEDIRGDLASAWALVCPLRSGSGSRLKIMEAMAVGTPVVSTPIGCRGLPVKHGEHIIVSTLSRMHEDTVALLMDKALQEHLSHEARRLAETRLTWRDSVSSLRTIYSEIV